MSDRISELPAADETVAGGDLVAATNVSHVGTGETQKFTHDQFLLNMLLLEFRAATELTLSTGGITVTQTTHKLQPEAGTADDLDTINGMSAGDIVVLYTSDAGTDTITIKHGTGNISCVGGADIILSEGMVIGYYGGTTVYVTGGLGPEINEQIQLIGSSITPATTNGCGFVSLEMTTNKNTLTLPAFDKDTIEYGDYWHELPADYDGGTITYHVNWTHPATTTNFKVAWALKAVAIADDGSLDAAYGTAIQVNDTGGTTSDEYKTPESAVLTIAGTPLAGKTVNWRIYRVATDGTNDTLAVDAYLINVVITYTRTA